MTRKIISVIAVLVIALFTVLAKNANAGNISLTTGWNLVGNAFPIAKNIVDAGLDSATGNNIPSRADRIYLYNKDAGTFDQVYRRTDGEWRKVGESSVTTERLEISEGFWMNIQSGFVWDYE